MRHTHWAMTCPGGTSRPWYVAAQTLVAVSSLSIFVSVFGSSASQESLFGVSLSRASASTSRVPTPRPGRTYHLGNSLDQAKFQKLGQRVKKGLGHRYLR